MMSSRDGKSSDGKALARTSAAIGGRYRAFFFSAVAATLLLQVMIVTDTIIVGQLLGPVPMSGVRVASPVVNILNVVAMLIGGLNWCAKARLEPGVKRAHALVRSCETRELWARIGEF